jgi:eukaryotic-like serine/threonine-protein kinase
MSLQARQIYEFGPFRIDTAERVLLREDTPVPLTPKAFDVLLLLVESHGHIVKKEEVMDRVWADSFVEEGNLKATVSIIRKALGETRGTRGYIETVARQGYRFKAAVTESSITGTLTVQERSRAIVTIEEETDAGDEAGIPVQSFLDAARSTITNKIGGAQLIETNAAESNRSGQHLTLRVRQQALRDVVLALACAVLCAFVAALLYRAVWHGSPAAFSHLKALRLTNSGNTLYAAISPDGKYVANVTEESGRQGLWIKLVATANGVQIIPTAEVEFKGLAFSRDPNFVYYTACARGDRSVGLFQVSVLGGPAKRLQENVDSPPTFAPDRNHYAFVRERKDLGVSTLIAANLEGEPERQLASRPLPDFLDYPAWSPDGKVIVCTVVYSGRQQVGLTAVDAKLGTETPFTSRTWPYIVQPKWLKDGSRLIIGALERSSRNFQLWRLAYPTAEVDRITDDYNDYEGVSVTDDGAALVTVQKSLISTVWTCNLAAPDRVQQITDTAGSFRDPVWTPTRRLVYSLAVNDKGDLWSMNADGSDQRQLTFDEASDSAPSLTPDGRRIVFCSDRMGSSDIWRCDIDGSNLKQLTHGGSDLSPQCSPDGQWVVYISVGRGHPTVWRVSIEGGEPVQLTSRPVRRVAVSPDGNWLACLDSSESAISPESPPAITIVSFTGGEVRRSLSLPSQFVQAREMRWTPNGQAIVLVARREGALNIWMQPIDGSAPRPLTKFKHNELLSFGLSRDGELVYSRGNWSKDAVLMSSSWQARPRFDVFEPNGSK